MSSVEYISSTTLSTASASIVFGSGDTLPQNYNDLILVCLDRSTDTNAYGNIRFNGDTATNYSRTRLLAYVSGVLSSRDNSQSSILAGSATLSNATAGIYSLSTHQINNYSSASIFKTVISTASDPGNTDSRVHIVAGTWRNTTAITTLSYIHPSANFAVGSTFTLWGVK